MRPDDDRLVVDQLIDRADRRHGVQGEHDPAQRHAAQHLPELVDVPGGDPAVLDRLLAR
jgi:hypothetical protein